MHKAGSSSHCSLAAANLTISLTVGTKALREALPVTNAPDHYRAIPGKCCRPQTLNSISLLHCNSIHYREYFVPDGGDRCGSNGGVVALFVCAVDMVVVLVFGSILSIRIQGLNFYQESQSSADVRGSSWTNGKHFCLASRRPGV